MSQAYVPGLILQPLVENAIKYGVSRASRPVTVTITAKREGPVLSLNVADNGDVMPDDDDKGSGIGLTNVRDRLEARFGQNANIQWHRPLEGGFSVTVTIPFMIDS